MKGPRRADGYALVAALVIIALAGTLAALCIAAASAQQEISGVDRQAAAATAAINEGLDDVCGQLRWIPQTRSGTRRSAPGTGSRWAATWRPAIPAAAGTPRLTLDLTSMDARAQRSLQAIVELRPELVSQGVVVSGDVDLRAPTTISGSGVYTGGCLRGRQWLRFTSGDLAARLPPRATRCIRRCGRWPASALWAASGQTAMRFTLRERPPHGRTTLTRTRPKTALPTSRAPSTRTCSAR